MAGYRQFHTQFWKDEWLIELEPLERYLFSYLFTNDLSSISGIYKLPLRVILNETGLDREFVNSTLQKFQDAQKIFYKDGVMWVVNMKRYHKNASPRTMTKVNADVREIPDCAVKTAYLYYEKTGIYSIDTVSIPRSEIVSLSESESLNRSESETPLYPPLPETALYTEVTGLVPDVVTEQKVVEKVRAIRAFHKSPPHDRMIELMTAKFSLWKSSKTKDGRPYNPSNPDWLDWCITGYSPVPANGNGRVRMLKGADGQLVEDR